MKKRKNSKIVLGLLLAVIGLGIGYAAIAGVSLLVSGTASVKSSDGNFVVRFVRNDANETAIENPTENAITIVGHNANETLMDVSGMTASIEDDTHATFAVGELDEVGEYVEFTYMVVNESDGIDAMLSFDVADVNDGEKYFEITKTVDKAIIGEDEVATVKVKVVLIDRPVVDDFDASFELTLNATPVEEEDIAGSITGTTAGVTSAATLAKAIQNNSVDTIELDRDITVDKKANLEISDDTTIDFKGHTLTVEPGSIKVSNGASLTLTDDTGNGGITATKNAITVESGSEVIVESGKYETTEFSGKGGVITIPTGVDNAKITINGGTISGKYFAINSWGNNDIEINGGNISSISSSVLDKEDGKSYYAYAVKLTGGHLEMNDGSVTGVHGGIAIEGSATATINGGTVTLNNRGTNDSFYCFYLDGQGSVEVIDGTFTNNGTRSLVYTSSTELVNLRGGNWTGKSTYPFNNKKNGAIDLIKIYGGTYKKDTNGTLSDYDVAGYRVN